MTNFISTYIEEILSTDIITGVPPLPPVEPGKYYVRKIDGKPNGDGQVVAFDSLAQANGVPPGSTVYFWGGTGDGVNLPDVYTVSQTWYPTAWVTFKSFGAGLAVIKAAALGGSAAVQLLTNS